MKNRLFKNLIKLSRREKLKLTEALWDSYASTPKIVELHKPGKIVKSIAGPFVETDKNRDDKN